MVKNMVQEKKIGLDESCLDGWHAEMREKTLILQKGAPIPSVSSQPHEKSVLKPLEPSKVSDGCSAPGDTAVFNHGPNVSLNAYSKAA